MAEVTEADRRAYCDYEDLDGKYREKVMAGEWDAVAGVQLFARYRQQALEEACIAVRDCMVAQDWPPTDGDQQIDEVLAAIRALGQGEK